MRNDDERKKSHLNLLFCQTVNVRSMKEVTGEKFIYLSVFRCILLYLSVQFVLRAEIMKIENKYMTAMFAVFQNININTVMQCSILQYSRQEQRIPDEFMQGTLKLLK